MAEGKLNNLRQHGLIERTLPEHPSAVRCHLQTRCSLCARWKMTFDNHKPNWVLRGPLFAQLVRVLISVPLGQPVNLTHQDMILAPVGVARSRRFWRHAQTLSVSPSRHRGEARGRSRIEEAPRDLNGRLSTSS